MENQQKSYLYAHTHWDREWYLSFRQYQARLLTVMDEILDALETGLLPNFTLDGQTILLEDYHSVQPNNKQRIKNLIAQGKLEIGPWYVMPDEFLVSSESLIRNLKKGMTQAKHFGIKHPHTLTGYLPDTFGHSQDIPTILKGFGINTAIVWRGVNPKSPAFIWSSPDGSELKTYHLTEGYFQMMLHDVDLNGQEKIQELQNFEKRLQENHNSSPLIPIGGDHLGLPHAEILKSAKEHYPDEQWLTTATFMNKHIQPTLEADKDPLKITGELIDNSAQFILPGVYSSRLYLKKANKKLEHQLTELIEPLMALTYTINPNAFTNNQALLDTAWQQLLLNHPHDSICGCSTDEVHRQNEVRFNEVADITHYVIDNCVADILSVTKNNDNWIVINTDSQPYTGVVHIREEAVENSQLHQLGHKETQLIDQWRFDTRQVPLSHKVESVRHGWIFVENLPPMSVNQIPKTAAALPDDSLKQTLQIDKNGRIIVSSETGTQEIPFKILIRPEQGDSYNGAPIPNTKTDTAQLISIKNKHQGNLVNSFLLTHQYNKQIFETEVTLKTGDPVVYFETTFTNTLNDICVQASFDTEKPIETILAETHLGTVERHYDPDYDITQHMPALPQKELNTNTGVIQRFIEANGHYFVTEGLTEYEVNKNTLRLTLLRTFNQISSPNTGVRGTQAGPPFETPEGQCLNKTMSFRYGWCPQPKSTEKQFHSHWHCASRFYGNVFAVDDNLLKTESKSPKHLSREQEKSTRQFRFNTAFTKWDNPAIIKTACYPTPKGTILRLLNTSSQPQTCCLNFIIPPTSIEKVNLMEEQIESIDSKTGTSIDFDPHQLTTLQINF